MTTPTSAKTRNNTRYITSRPPMRDAPSILLVRASNSGGGDRVRHRVFSCMLNNCRVSKEVAPWRLCVAPMMGIDALGDHGPRQYCRLRSPGGRTAAGSGGPFSFGASKSRALTGAPHCGTKAQPQCLHFLASRSTSSAQSGHFTWLPDSALMSVGCLHVGHSLEFPSPPD
jgi:hypothetical protein